MNIPGVIAASTAGSMIGALLLYGVGRLLSQEKLEKILDGRLGKTLRFRKNDLGRAVGWFTRRGASTVFLCRFIPIVRSLISIPAGVAKMPLGKFLVFTAGGTLIWNTVLVSLGAVAGSSWQTIVDYAAIYSELLLILLCFLGIAFLVYYYRHRIKTKK